MPKLIEYDDLLASVRNDGRFHSIRSLVQPNDPAVKEVADVFVRAPNFLSAAQDFTDSFTVYRTEVGDFWRTPGETLAIFSNYWEEARRTGHVLVPECDCDCKAILLCSILRNYIPADRVFCAVGVWSKFGKGEGHMWVEVSNGKGDSRIIESTAPSSKQTYGIYQISALFNDEYTFSTVHGLKTFGLIPVEEVVSTLEETGAIYSKGR